MALTTISARTASRPIELAPVRMTSRGRIVFVLALVLVAFLAVSLLRTGTQAGAGTASTGSATRTVTVHTGETLWQIALQVAPSVDPRDTIDRIRDLNSLDTTVVQAGQRLIVPAAG
jgi:hypothetical protein